MKKKLSFKTLSQVSITLSLVVGVYATATDLSTVPLNTYSATSSTDVKPNLMFLLDDSGSMNSNYLPDSAQSNIDSQFLNVNFNGLAYNPGSRYLPPTVVTSSTGALDTTTYPSMDGTTTLRGANSSAKPNWNSVKDDAYGQVSNNISSLTPTTNAPPATPNSNDAGYPYYNSAPYFYTTVPGEYCTNTGLRNCTTASSATGTYTVPAYLRWCNSRGLTTCQFGYDSSTSFTRPRQPSPRTATVTISGSSSTSVSGITVDGFQIMSGSAAATTSSSTLASAIADQINLCTFAKVGNCTAVGYMASTSNSTVTITAPNVTSSSPVIAKLGTMTLTAIAFAQGSVPGENIRTTITPSIDSYPFPGTSVKDPHRTDCAGTTCTYAEEMTNYANWWTYYQTRIQMMKTAASNAFANLDTSADMAAGKSRFRVGYMTINNNQGNAFVNLGEFTGNQKFTWYSRLLNAQAGSSTPTRQTLADAGRLYSGKLNGTSYNSVTVTDPVQYYCQHNYTLLSTDGFWNQGAGYKLDGSTMVGNQDGGDPPPYGDGGTATLQRSTSTLQSGTNPAQFQQSTSQLQSTTSTTLTAPSIQENDTTDKWSTSTGWYNNPACVTVGRSSRNTQHQCRYPISTSTDSGTTWSAWGWVVDSVSAPASCTPKLTGTNQTACASGTYYGPATNVNSCTNSGNVTCSYTAWTTPVVVNSCQGQAQSTSSPYTVGTAVQCTPGYGTPTTWNTVTSGTCTTSLTNSCRYSAWSAPVADPSCIAVAQDSGPTYSTRTAVQCQSVSTGGTSDTMADVAAYYYKTNLRSFDPNDGTGTCIGPIISPSTTHNNLCTDSTHQVPTYGRDVATYQHMTTFTLGLGAEGKMLYAPQNNNDYWKDTSGDFYDVLQQTPASPTTGICSWLTAGTHCTWPTPASDSNANIDDLWHAAINGHGTYFSAKDPAGLSGALTGVLSAISNVPDPGTAAAAASSNPNVSSSDNFVFSSSYESVLWYGELVRQQIDPLTGSLTPKNWYAQRLLDCASRAWVAGASYPQYAAFRYVSGGNTYCYWVNNAAGYTAGSTFDSTNTSISVVNVDEAASSKTPLTTVQSSRTIYTKGASGLINFDYATLNTAGLTSTFTQSFLSNSNSTTAPRVSQFCVVGISCLSSNDQTNNASGSNLVNYLRGDPTYEGRYYRARTHVLGDIVSSEASYVKTPLLNYSDAGFSAFKTAMSTRVGTVYVGANDGMLHAFDATSGQEKWAYVPGMVLPNMYQLADMNYANNHQYFVDATPAVGDICVSGTSTPCANSSGITASNWKTILVGGLNRGGQGYYALDITDPASPRYLWEITSATTGFTNLGYTYGDPQITKLADGTWVVLLTSGYNGANGTGYLYVVNANTGALINTISTGTTADMARVVAYVANGGTDNTALAAYGGDTLGNLWRFDINNSIGASGYDAQILVSFKDASGKAQPITAKPTLASVNISSGTTLPIVYVGTGRFLGLSDIGDTSQQSFYGVVDRLNTTTFANPRSTGSNFVQQTLTSGQCPSGAPLSVCSPTQTVLTSTANSVNWTSQNGWYIDFVNTGERSFTDPSLELGTVLFTTIVPSVASADPCAAPGNAYSYIYALNYLTGGAIANSLNVSGQSLGQGVATRPVMIELADGTVRSLTRISNGQQTSSDPLVKNVNVSVGSNGLRRVSWRELTTQ